MQSQQSPGRITDPPPFSPTDSSISQQPQEPCHSSSTINAQPEDSQGWRQGGVWHGLPKNDAAPFRVGAARLDAAASPAMAYMMTGQPRYHRDEVHDAIILAPSLPCLPRPDSWHQRVGRTSSLSGRSLETRRCLALPGARRAGTPTSPTRRRHEKSFMSICEPLPDPPSACSLREHDRPTCHYQRDGKQLPKQNNRHPGRPLSANPPHQPDPSSQDPTHRDHPPLKTTEAPCWTTAL